MYYQLEKATFIEESQASENILYKNLLVFFLTIQVLWLFFLLAYADRKSSLEITCCIVQLLSVLTLTRLILYKSCTEQFN